MLGRTATNGGARTIHSSAGPLQTGSPKSRTVVWAGSGRVLVLFDFPGLPIKTPVKTPNGIAVRCRADAAEKRSRDRGERARSMKPSIATLCARPLGLFHALCGNLVCLPEEGITK